MKQLVEYIVSNLVNHPEDVVIEEQSTDDAEFTLINIQVNQEDIGRVIGKSGKVIKAIRQIVRIAAIQKGLKVRVDLIDQNASTPQTEAPQAKEEVLETEAPQAKEEVLETEAPQAKEEVLETEAPQKEPVNENETAKQVYPEAETLETEPKTK